MAQLTPLVRSSLIWEPCTKILPLLPTPLGILTEIPYIILLRFFLISLEFKLVLKTLTPHEISNPTPPGDITPSSMSVAATPPIGNP